MQYYCCFTFLDRNSFDSIIVHVLLTKTVGETNDLKTIHETFLLLQGIYPGNSRRN